MQRRVSRVASAAAVDEILQEGRDIFQVDFFLVHVTDAAPALAFSPAGVLAHVPQYCPGVPHLNGRGQFCLIWPTAVKTAYQNHTMEGLQFRDVAVRSQGNNKVG